MTNIEKNTFFFKKFKGCECSIKSFFTKQTKLGLITTTIITEELFGVLSINKNFYYPTSIFDNEYYRIDFDWVKQNNSEMYTTICLLILTGE